MRKAPAVIKGMPSHVPARPQHAGGCEELPLPAPRRESIRSLLNLALRFAPDAHFLRLPQHGLFSTILVPRGAQELMATPASSLLRLWARVDCSERIWQWWRWTRSEQFRPANPSSSLQSWHAQSFAIKSLKICSAVALSSAAVFWLPVIVLGTVVTLPISVPCLLAYSLRGIPSLLRQWIVPQTNSLLDDDDDDDDEADHRHQQRAILSTPPTLTNPAAHHASTVCLPHSPIHL